jgi:large repetitive protein
MVRRVGRILFAIVVCLVFLPSAVAFGSSGGVSGVVTDLAGAPLAGISVQVNDTDGSFATSTITDATGSYGVGGLPPGDYAVVFAFASGTAALDYAPQMDTVTVSDGATASGVSARLGPGGELSGTATNSLGAPIAGLDVTAALCSNIGAVDAAPAAITVTDADGRYAVYGLAAGSYTIDFNWTYSVAGGDGAPQFYGGPTVSSATCVPVAAGAATSGIDVQLAPTGQISGVVTDTSGGPLPGQTVFADGSGPDSTQNVITHAGVDGSFTISGLGPGQYIVGFEGGGFPTTYYTGGGDSLTGELLTVTAGATLGGIDEMLQPAGQISGTVTGPGGAWLGSAGTPATRAVTAILDGHGPSVGIDPDGTYAIDDVPPGLHTIEFFTEPCSVYVTQFLGAAETLAAAQQIDVSAGLTTPDVDASMQLAPPPDPAAACNAAPPAATPPLPTPPAAARTAPPATAGTGLLVTTKSVELSARGIAAITVLCPSAKCRGTASLSLAEPGNRVAQTRGTRLRMIGDAAFSSNTPGQTVARVHISRAGLRLLRAAHGRATASVTVTGIEAGQHESRTASVVLHTPRVRRQ